jgi:hypothetical protein
LGLLSVFFVSVLLRYSKKRKKRIKKESYRIFNSEKLPGYSVRWRAKCNPTTTTRLKKIFFFFFFFFFFRIHFTNKFEENKREEVQEEDKKEETPNNEETAGE